MYDGVFGSHFENVEKCVKRIELERLKSVAKRNADLYKFYPDEFEETMSMKGYKQSEIDFMKNYIEKLGGKPEEK